MKRVRRKAVWGAALAFWLMVPAPCAAQYPPQKIDRPLADAGSSGGPKRVIIRTKAGAKHHVRLRLEAHGDGVLGEHTLVDALTARVHPEDVAALAADPNVESISTDAPVHASGGKKADAGVPKSQGKKRGSRATAVAEQIGAYVDAGFTLSPLKQALGLSDTFSGSSVTIALIDSGIAPLQDFSGRIVGSYDFTSGRNGVAIPAQDEYGHGTHVAGLIGSSGASSRSKYAGIAPGVKFLSLKVLDKKGTGHTSSVIRALEFAVANKDTFGLRVVNLSLGHPIYESVATDPLVQAVENAVRAGLVVVVAAGNRGVNPATGLAGYSGIVSPGNAPSAITVGAASTRGTMTRADDRVARYSSRGPTWFDGIAKPDVVAPGDAMISNDVTNSTLSKDCAECVVREGSSRYLTLSGSSMATGVVTGLVATMLDASAFGASSRMTVGYIRGKQPQQQRSVGDVYLDGQTTFSAPPLTANAVKGMLQYSATRLRDASGVTYDALTQGTGLVNGAGAVSLAYHADTTRPVNTFWLTTTVSPWTVFGGVTEAWSEAMIWGTRLVTGSSVAELHQPAWADNIVWGTGELDNIVWGTVNETGNLVWGTAVSSEDVVWAGNAQWGDNIVWGTAEWVDNIVWGTSVIGFFDGQNIVWGTFDADNIVWGTLTDDNIVWGTNANKVTILGLSVSGGGL